MRRLGLELNFFNKDGSFKGPREMVAQLEKLAEAQGLPLDGSTSDDQLNDLWEQVKAGEKSC